MFEQKRFRNRLRSKKAWAATFALVFFVLKNYFHTEIPDADILISLIMLVGVTWGIWTNP